jgi:DNA adenine methylase
MSLPSASGLPPAAVPALSPLFRWPGGKRWLVPRLLTLVPPTFGRYFEPFFGAGALFFSLNPETARISDSNSDLMDCYRTIRDEPSSVALTLQEMPCDRETYYKTRASKPTNEIDRAARLIYLTTLAFNGIYRVNLRGEFNVPYSGRDHADMGSAAVLSRYAEALGHAEITSGDFEHGLEGARSGDIVYLDPPYTVAHSHNGFLKYNDRIFSWHDQQRLAAVAAELARQGCHVVISNADHESIRDLYPSFRKHRVRRTSVMAADKERRGAIGELVLTNV